MNFKDLLNKGANHCFAFVFLLCLLLSNRANAQTVTIEGTVKDAAGLSLPGVNVLEKGTKNGTSTDFDGHYKLKLTNPKAVLSFSFIGFKSIEIPTEGKAKVNATMSEDSNNLNEVVVIGYGTSKKSDLTGAVATFSGNEMRKIPVPNVAEALTGRIAGVQVTSSEGSPDSNVQIRIRGNGSLTQDASPLYIVDGFPVNNINDISSSDIDTMTILKDASSTAIYGSRGAYGVVIVTTKKGKDGKVTVNYNMFYGMKKIANTIDVTAPEDYVKWQYEYALLKDNTDLSSYEKYFGSWQDYDMYKGMKGNDWQRQVFGRTGEVQSRDLSIRGGSDKMNYNFNYAHYDEKAIMNGSDFNRNNLSLALNSKASDKVDLSFTMRYSDTEINGGGMNEQNEVSSADSRLKNIVGYAPIPVPGLTTDDTDEAVSDNLVHPFVAIADTDRQQFRKNFNMLGSFSWKLTSDLVFKTELGWDNYNYLDYRYFGRSTYYVKNNPAAERQGMPAMIMGDRKDTRFRNVNTLNYDLKKFVGENHSLKLLFGEESIEYKRNDVNTAIHGYPLTFGLDQAKKLTTQGTPVSVDNFYFPDDKLLSFFGRVNYDYKDRYLFTATYRADGSSKFLGDNKWGFFPAAAAAWKISGEEFMKNASWVNLLKLRVSYGEAGNNNIPTGQMVQSFTSTTSTWINGVDNYWAPSKTMANPDLKWETTVTQNLGLDFDLFKNRVTGSVEVYKNITKDLLINFPISGGYDFQFRNMGEVQNSGVEATLNLNLIEREKFGVSLSLNAGFNTNKINSLGVMSNFGASSGWASTAIGNDYLVNVGQSIGVMYGYKSDGRYEVSDFNYNAGAYTLKTGVPDGTTIVGPMKPGAMKLKDIDGDGKVNANDLTVIGNANPKTTGGFVLNANAYGFDLSAAFNYSIGNDVYNANKVEFSTSIPNGQYRNLDTEMADGTRWTNFDPNTGQLVTDPAALTALNANTTMWSPYMPRYVFSDWAVEDGSFLRLNTLSLGYTTPNDLTSALGISKLRFYLTASNVFVWTKYTGQDPEASTRRNTPLTPGVDYSAYPRSRQLIFGLNLNF
ncbi:TonB-linked outer membrane protein, SusC/RagA family [Flavobacterium sp. CF108]|uniref:SusC/RagA family TonB-linked outer membrane protein n=1 Tax=unclassified Flavobacterium TaxID=196869 RepID=UPI0008B32C0F|nr:MULTISPECIES: TonB-dependent receptor [unclassified Flavobacterium]SEO44454.1 TonB-linked outer membrane protein, SusC/RagA family [Flavobacterium sp. fv08]SHH69269.1 TonB-linked outer membrane protein, SusC/RagA family [Flavobacterium sp. CF108]